MSKSKLPPKPPQKPKRRKTTNRLLNRADQVQVSVDARAFFEQNLAYQAKEFLLCGLPYQQPKKQQFERRNGHFSCKLIGDEKVGLPYGQDRLLIIWMATAFQLLGCPEDNIIRFRSASDIVRAFYHNGQERSPTGQERVRIKERFQRLFYTTYYFATHSRGYFNGESFRLIRRTRLWFNTEKPNAHWLWQNYIVLSNEFADLIRKGSIPIDLDTVRGLKESPATLDLYIWLSWRTYKLKTDGGVPLFGPAGLFAQLGTATIEPRKARQQLKAWLHTISLFWPQCPAELSEDGEYLLLHPPRAYEEFAIQANVSILLPGVTKNPPVRLLSDDELPPGTPGIIKSFEKPDPPKPKLVR
jgi:Plasmid encoded RepA protein